MREKAILILSIMFLIFCVYNLVSLFFKGIEIRKRFIDFLKKENDTEVLKKMGAIDSYGQESYSRVSYLLIRNFILQRYELTKKEEYKNFDQDMSDRMKELFPFMLFLMVGIMLVVYAKSLF